MMTSCICSSDGSSPKKLILSQSRAFALIYTAKKLWLKRMLLEEFNFINNNSDIFCLHCLGSRFDTEAGYFGGLLLTPVYEGRKIQNYEKQEQTILLP